MVSEDVEKVLAYKNRLTKASASEKVGKTLDLYGDKLNGIETNSCHQANLTYFRFATICVGIACKFSALLLS
ncbi:hypothetical protein CK516_39330 [Nostoc sp. 'Peltigera malacea cyanobiont' DB3992]|nr:hypothetical protein CK516_39330 [Nostoc sp. 'Peltigera malacea cyanobiont' DB3992]